ncbi:unnamed protein product [Ambrosiozyma monospora]|uniref:Unnamed protein product n=1 Tax=Ambrosiozyma monospora TaxID=43982 RepID=A0ACB5SR63_AMBMO|nr:unnamed protein product [Ambrosiozyma monospora]
MVAAKLNSTEAGIKLASSLLPEIQYVILKFTIVDFLCFMCSHNSKLLSEHSTIICSNHIQTQLVSMTGYDHLLDDIISKTLHEPELTLQLDARFDPPFIYEFINFVTSRSIQLKTVKLRPDGPDGPDDDDPVKKFNNPNTKKLLEFHSDEVSFLFFNVPDYLHYINSCYLKFVTSICWPAHEIPNLLDSHLLERLTSLTKLSFRD